MAPSTSAIIPPAQEPTTSTAACSRCRIPRAWRVRLRVRRLWRRGLGDTDRRNRPLRCWHPLPRLLVPPAQEPTTNGGVLALTGLAGGSVMANSISATERSASPPILPLRPADNAPPWHHQYERVQRCAHRRHDGLGRVYQVRLDPLTGTLTLTGSNTYNGPDRPPDHGALVVSGSNSWYPLL